MQKAHQKIIILNLKKKRKTKQKKRFFFFGGGEGIMGSWKQASNHTIITELKIEAQVLKSQHH